MNTPPKSKKSKLSSSNQKKPNSLLQIKKSKHPSSNQKIERLSEKNKKQKRCFIFLN